MQKLLHLIRTHINEPLVLVRAMASKGSTPLAPYSKMLVTQKGRLYGTVGGGIAEAFCLKEAALCLQTHINSSLNINMAGEPDTALICGGECTVSLEYLGPFENFSHTQTRAPYSKLEKALGYTLYKRNMGANALHSPVVRETCISLHPFSYQGPAILLSADGHTGTFSTQVAQEARAYNGQNPCFITLEGETYIREVWQPAPRLLICGGGHVGAATCTAALLAGFDVILMDDRTDYCQKKNFPGIIAALHTPDYRQCFQNLCVDSRTGIIILSRGHHADETILRQALCTQAGYIGMIGSTRKRDTLYNKIEKDGFNSALLKTVHSPIGIPIGAKSPGEIAISIVAECVAWKAHLQYVEASDDF